MHILNRLIYFTLLTLALWGCTVPTIDAPIPPTPLLPSPTLADVPTPTATATANEPHITALANLNLRIGPGLDYAIAASLAAGTQTEVRGQTPDGTWWLVVDPANERELWVSADPTLTAFDPGDGAPDARAVPVIQVEIVPAQDALTLPQLHQFDVGANVVAISPDNSLLALGTFDHQVHVYNTADWSLRWQASHADQLQGLAFSPDGHTLVSTGFDGAVQAWSAAEGTLRYRLDYTGWAHGPSFSDDSFLMASAAFSRESTVVQSESGELVGKYMNELPVHHLALAPDGPWLTVMTAGSWGPVELTVWDIFTHERRTLARYEGPPNPTNVIFSPNTQWLAASVEPGGPLRVWQTQSWNEVAQLRPELLANEPPGISPSIRQIAFSPDGRYLAAVIMPNILATYVQLWAVESWTPATRIPLGDIALDMIFTPDSQSLVTIHGQGEPPIPPLNEGRLWDIATGELLTRMPHNSQVQGAAVSHDEAWIVTGSADGTTRVWANTE